MTHGEFRMEVPDDAEYYYSYHYCKCGECGYALEFFFGVWYESRYITNDELIKFGVKECQQRKK